MTFKAMREPATPPRSKLCSKRKSKMFAVSDRLLEKADDAVARIGEHSPLFQGFLDLIDLRRRDEGGALLAPREKGR